MVDVILLSCCDVRVDSIEGESPCWLLLFCGRRTWSNLSQTIVLLKCNYRTKRGVPWTTISGTVATSAFTVGVDGNNLTTEGSENTLFIDVRNAYLRCHMGKTDRDHKTFNAGKVLNQARLVF